MRALNASREVPETAPAKRKRRRAKNEPALEIQPALYTLLGGIDLTQIDGIGPYSALRIVAECGTDMSRFATAKHFTS